MTCIQDSTIYPLCINFYLQSRIINLENWIPVTRSKFFLQVTHAYIRILNFSSEKFKITCGNPKRPSKNLGVIFFLNTPLPRCPVVEWLKAYPPNQEWLKVYVLHVVMNGFPHRGFSSQSSVYFSIFYDYICYIFGVRWLIQRKY